MILDPPFFFTRIRGSLRCICRISSRDRLSVSLLSNNILPNSSLLETALNQHTPALRASSFQQLFGAQLMLLSPSGSACLCGGRLSDGTRPCLSHYTHADRFICNRLSASVYVSLEGRRVTKHLSSTATHRGRQAASPAELLLDRGARISRHRHPISGASCYKSLTGRVVEMQQQVILLLL